MRKLILTVLLCLNVCFFSSCTYYENVTFVERNSQQCLSYQGSTYRASDIFTASKNYGTPNDQDVELGKFYSFPFTTYFYSDTAENPVYIYSIGGDTGVYLKEDFDYQSELFVIKGTSAQIIFSEAMAEPYPEYDPLKESGRAIELVMYAEKHPDLKASVLLFSENNGWYAVLASDEAYLASQALVSLLRENGIIKG